MVGLTLFDLRRLGKACIMTMPCHETPVLTCLDLGRPIEYGRYKRWKVPCHSQASGGKHCGCIQGYGYFVRALNDRLLSAYYSSLRLRFEEFPKGDQINGEACKIMVSSLFMAHKTQQRARQGGD